jgi:hypothetical protein
MKEYFEEFCAINILTWFDNDLLECIVDNDRFLKQKKHSFAKVGIGRPSPALLVSPKIHTSPIVTESFERVGIGRPSPALLVSPETHTSPIVTESFERVIALRLKHIYNHCHPPRMTYLNNSPIIATENDISAFTLSIWK